MDSQKLAEMLAAIQQQHLNLHSLLIIRNGYLVSETYFGPYQPDTRHELYSCTKSFVATLIGIALDKGYIDGTDQRIVDFFPERTFANLDAAKGSHDAGGHAYDADRPGLAGGRSGLSSHVRQPGLGQVRAR